MIVSAFDAEGLKVPVRLEPKYATAYRPRLRPPTPWTFEMHEQGLLPYPGRWDRAGCPEDWPFKPGTIADRFKNGLEVEIVPVRETSPQYWPSKPGKYQLFVSAVYHVASAERAAELLWVAELRHVFQADHVHYDPDSGITHDVGGRSLAMLTDSEVEDWMRVNKYRMPTRSPVVGPFDREDLERIVGTDTPRPYHTIDGVPCVTPEQVARGLGVGIRRVYRWLQRPDVPRQIGGIKYRGRTPRSYPWPTLRPFLEARVKRGLPEDPADLRPPLTAR